MSHLFPLQLATTNPGKAEEWNAILRALVRNGAPQVSVLRDKVPMVELQSLDPVVVAVTKALSACCHYQKPLLVEDVSYSFDALGGFPGPLYAFAEKTLSLDGLLRLIEGDKDRKVTVTQTIAFADATCSNVYVVKHVETGKAPMMKRGTNGFGFDAIFCPGNLNVTYAEMGTEQKNATSMRRRAIEKLLKGDWEKRHGSESPLFRIAMPPRAGQTD